MLGFLPVFSLVQALHWLGFWLDELFFRGYRQIEIKEPVFIVGVPRSGTTFLHRVLAEDKQFTTFSTWECLFALSITERKFWLGMAKLDRLIGGPFVRLIRRVESHVFGGLEGIHKVTLDTPEEDYFAFTPILACFILILPFPFAASIWRMGFFDRDMTSGERRRMMAYYRACLQKHLYVHGPHKRLLSKNASFAPLVASLRTTFPDCRIICCMRDPVETVPSQLSAIRVGMELFANDPQGDDFRDRMLELLLFYYENLLNVLPQVCADRHVFLDMNSLKADLANSVSYAYQRLSISLSADFAGYLQSADRAARRHRTDHRYSLDEFGLDGEAIRKLFARVYDSYEFSGLLKTEYFQPAASTARAS